MLNTDKHGHWRHLCGALYNFSADISYSCAFTVSTYRETVLIDIFKCKASSSTLISHIISIKIIALKIINLKSSLYLVPYIWNFLHIPELKLVIPIVLFANWIRPFRFVRDNLNLFSCIYNNLFNVCRSHRMWLPNHPSHGPW